MSTKLYGAVANLFAEEIMTVLLKHKLITEEEELQKITISGKLGEVDVSITKMKGGQHAKRNY